MRFLSAAIAFGFLIGSSSIVSAGNDGWVPLMDGKTFDGWKVGQNRDSWSLEDGAFVAHGKYSHLFYVGDDRPFVNFELSYFFK